MASFNSSEKMFRTLTREQVKHGLLSGTNNNLGITGVSIKKMMENAQNIMMMDSSCWTAADNYKLVEFFHSIYTALDWVSCLITNDPETNFAQTGAGALRKAGMQNLVGAFEAIQQFLLLGMYEGVKCYIDPMHIWETFKHCCLVSIGTIFDQELGHCFVMGPICISRASAIEFLTVSNFLVNQVFPQQQG